MHGEGSRSFPRSEVDQGISKGRHWTNSPGFGCCADVGQLHLAHLEHPLKTNKSVVPARAVYPIVDFEEFQGRKKTEREEFIEADHDQEAVSEGDENAVTLQ